MTNPAMQTFQYDIPNYIKVDTGETILVEATNNDPGAGPGSYLGSATFTREL